ncbi:unnamed protein product, partial [Symbiodinium natans]
MVKMAASNHTGLQNVSVNLAKTENKESIVGFEGSRGPLGFEMLMGGSTGCRGSSPSDIQSTYYQIFTGKDVNACRDTCYKDVTCTGIGQPQATTCGNWRVPIEATTFNHGDICYVAHRRVRGESSIPPKIDGYLVFEHVNHGVVNYQFFLDLGSANARFNELDGGQKAAGLYDAKFNELKYYGSNKDAITKDFYDKFKTLPLPSEKVGLSKLVEGVNGMLGCKISTLASGGTVEWDQTGLTAANYFGGMPGSSASPFLGQVASLASNILDQLLSWSQDADYTFNTSPLALDYIKE